MANLTWSRLRARLGSGTLGLLSALLIIYVAQLVLLRTPAGPFIEELYLSPHSVFRKGHVWQPFTYVWLHSPAEPFHLLFNGLVLFWFGPGLERIWGTRRFLRAYLIFAAGGALATLAWGLGAYAGLYFPADARAVHLGASGAIMGCAIAWGLVHANQPIHLLFIGQTRGIAIVWIFVGIEILRALSFARGLSVSSHVGGMLAAFVLCRGWWRPSMWVGLVRRGNLKRKKKSIERELRVISGGGQPRDPSDPKNWN